MTTEPPDTCPICGGESIRTDSNGQGQTDRVYFGCGAKWAMYTNNSTTWAQQCDFAMDACLRCGATLRPTAREQATAALVAALFAERKAWQKLAALTVGDDTSADACLLACQERDAAAEALDDAAIAYLATVTP